LRPDIDVHIDRFVLVCSAMMILADRFRRGSGVERVPHLVCADGL
jgi:hypothetical protein